MRTSRGFTLIELLIVVAIIAILAAIAVPNFLEAQTRSRVSRVKADMRSAATALESYQIDHNQYPFDGYNYDGSLGTTRYNYWFLPLDLSTPVAYLTTCRLVDPFRTHRSGEGHWQMEDVRYRNIRSTWGPEFGEIQSPARTSPSIYLNHMLQDIGEWDIVSVGPDNYWGPNANSSEALFPGGAYSWETPSGYPAHTQPYDPTNGTMSWGDIRRSQLSPTGYVNTP